MAASTSIEIDRHLTVDCRSRVLASALLEVATPVVTTAAHPHIGHPAVGSANGKGRPVAGRLLTGGESVLGVLTKLAARARVFDTRSGPQTDAAELHATVCCR